MPILTTEIRDLARHLHREGRLSAEALTRIERRTRCQDAAWTLGILAALSALLAARLLG